MDELINIVWYIIYERLWSSLFAKYPTLALSLTIARSTINLYIHCETRREELKRNGGEVNGRGKWEGVGAFISIHCYGNLTF